MHTYRLPFTRSKIITREPLSLGLRIRLLWRDLIAWPASRRIVAEVRDE